MVYFEDITAGTDEPCNDLLVMRAGTLHLKRFRLEHLAVNQRNFREEVLRVVEEIVTDGVVLDWSQALHVIPILFIDEGETPVVE